MVVESKKLILVVDDSGIQLRSVRAVLVDQYEVDVATDGRKAIEKAKKLLNKNDITITAIPDTKKIRLIPAHPRYTRRVCRPCRHGRSPLHRHGRRSWEAAYFQGSAPSPSPPED